MKLKFIKGIEINTYMVGVLLDNGMQVITNGNIAEKKDVLSIGAESYVSGWDDCVDVWICLIHKTEIQSKPCLTWCMQ